MRTKTEFPQPRTRQEMLLLEEPAKKYREAKSAMVFAGIALAASGIAIGADKLSDGELGPVSYFTSSFAGAAGVAPLLRNNRQRREALNEAHSIISPSPTDFPPILNNPQKN